MIPASIAVVLGAGFVFWQTVVAAPALSYGPPGSVHFKDNTATAGSEAMMYFDRTEWLRLCDGTLFTKLLPANVSDKEARTVDLEPHTISTPAQLGLLAPKARPTRIPASITPGVWRLAGHASNTCRVWLPLLGTIDVTVTTQLPTTLVTIRTP